jgi:hypothetical protein
MRNAFDQLVELYGDFSQPVGSPESPGPEITVNFPEVDLGLIPGRGFLYSLVLYAVIIPLLIFLPVSRAVPPYPADQWQVTMLPKDTIYLPQLGGGSRGGVKAGQSAKTPETAKPSSESVASKTGISYPGEQAIVSNPPNPTNHVQTILQPALRNPPTLNRFVPLPNVVKMVELSPAHALPGSLEVPQPVREVQQPEDRSAQATLSVQMPILPVGVQEPIEHPELTMPPQAPPAATDVPVQALLKPLVPIVPPPKPIRAQPQVLPGANGRDNRDLLVLSATPAPPSAATKIPQAESRGAFAITPLPPLAMSNLGPGSETAKAAASSVAIGKHPEPAVRDAAGGEREAAGKATKAVPGGNNSIAASKESGGEGGPTPAESAASAGMAAGNSAGAAAGSGFGMSVASGSGGGSGAGSGAFPGITIQGGEQSEGEVAGQTGGGSSSSEQLKYGTYGMTIVSNGNSGGGLKDFGVFAGRQVFTVYIGMKGPPGDPVPSWTMEYAQMRGSADPPGMLEAPFPSKKVSPLWPQGLPAKFHAQSIVLYAVVSREGRLLNMRIMQTPSRSLNGALLKALHGWVFLPARINGRPVAVEVLFGVPL